MHGILCLQGVRARAKRDRNFLECQRDSLLCLRRGLRNEARDIAGYMYRCSLYRGGEGESESYAERRRDLCFCL